MKVLGVTGGIGMGKSACAKLLRSIGIPVVDTDDLAHELVQPGQPALGDIAAAFGSEILDDNGALRRDELARRAFASASSRETLERILHPRIRESWRASVQLWRKEGGEMGAVIIPLLFETGAERELDGSLCVACSAQTQRERLLARGWSVDQIDQRIAAQLPIAAKMARSDYAIWSEGSLDLHESQLRRVLENFRRNESLSPLTIKR